MPEKNSGILERDKNVRKFSGMFKNVKEWYREGTKCQTEGTACQTSLTGLAFRHHGNFLKFLDPFSDIFELWSANRHFRVPPVFDVKYIRPGFKPSVTLKDAINGYSLPQYYSG